MLLAFSGSSVRHIVAICFLLTGLLAKTSRADNAAFDLIGPRFQVHVQRAGATLPIAEVPNLQAGDRLWVHPDLPDSQSVRYLMVVVFLRGATNPPPETWFTRAETWTKAVREEGIFVNVPPEAEQAIILLAPETGGDYSTLRAAVRGKPGAFVRAAQDLEQLSLDRSRLEAYLEAVRQIPESDPQQLKARTTLLARSLNIKVDSQCFDKPSNQQVPCLTQNTDQLVLDDQHSQSMVATLTSGPSTDLLTQLSATPTARAGYYSPYVGAVVDVVRILGTTHSAQYQYIPALALPKKDDLDLRLNNPPSFRNPKSVLVIALPPVHAAVAPPLHAVDPNQVFCLNKPELVLPADGAPLVFANELAHNFVLHVETKSGPGIDLPAHPDAGQGGFVIDTHGLPAKSLDAEVTGILRGSWGFHSFEGPRFHLRTSQPSQWTVASKDASALIIGREDTLHVDSPDVCCVSEVLTENQDGKIAPVEWKASKPDEIELKVPLQTATAGTLQILVKKFGLHKADEVSLHTYAEAARLDAFELHAGDINGMLRGTRLDEVSSLTINGITFTPAGLTRDNQHDELKLATSDSAAAVKLKPGTEVPSHVSLKDGRTLDLSTTIDAARPKLALLSKSVQLESDTSPVFQLGNPDELPQDGRLNFFLKTQMPETFPPGEKVEVATEDESFHVQLSEKDGNLTLQDAKTVYAVLDPMKLLGPSAFGPLKFRPVSGDGVQGDWQPLAKLVRIPELKGISCTPEATKEARAEQRPPERKRRTVTEPKVLGEKAAFKDSSPDSSEPDASPDAKNKNPAAAVATASRDDAKPVTDAEHPEPQKTDASDAAAQKHDVPEPGAKSEKKPDNETQCTLAGDRLFLIDAISADADFSNPVTVPDGFVSAALTVPMPKGKVLYVKLRDDPATIDTAIVPMLATP